MRLYAEARDRYDSDMECSWARDGIFDAVDACRAKGRVIIVVFMSFPARVGKSYLRDVAAYVVPCLS